MTIKPVAMKLSIIIPSHMRTQSCFNLIESLLRQTFTAPFEILVVANPANLELRQFIQSMAPDQNRVVRYFESSILGVNAARNLGLKQAHGDLALFLDDDCEVTDPLYLENLTRRFAEHPDATGIGGPYVQDSNSRSHPWDKAYAAIADHWLKGSRLVGARTTQLIGGNACYRKSVLLGGFLFNENLRFGGTESELNHRLIESGHKLLFFSDLAVVHHLEIGIFAFFRKAFLQGRGFEFRKKISPIPTVSMALQPDIPVTGFFSRIYYYLFQKGQIHFRLSQISGGSWFGFYSRFLGLWALQDLRSLWLRPSTSGSSASPRIPVEEELGRSRFYDPRFGLNLRHENNHPDTFVPHEFPKHLQRARLYAFDGILLPIDQHSFARQIQDANLKVCIAVDLNLWREEWIEILKTVRPSFVRASLSPFTKRNTQFISALRKLGIPLWLNWELAAKRDVMTKLPISSHDKSLLPIELRFSFELSSFRLRRFLRSVSTCPRLSPPIGAPLMDSALQEGRDLYPVGKTVCSTLHADSMPRVSVIIPSYKSEWELSVVLNHLIHQNFPPEAYEVLVIDDGSSTYDLENHTRWIQTHAGACQIRLLHIPRRLHDGGTDQQYRAGIARNLGVAMALGDIISFLDSDIVVPEDYLQRLMLDLEGYDVVQTRRLMLKSEASSPQTRVQQLRRYRDVYPEDSYWEDFKKAAHWMPIFNFWKYTCTYSLTLRKSLFQSAGWFCPTFPNYGFEDTDLGYRLAKMGATFKLSSLEVFHLYPRRQDFNFHVDQERRTSALAHSARIFYSHHLDDRVFREFHWLLVTRDNMVWKAQRLYWKAHRLKGEVRVSTVAGYWRARHALLTSAIRMYWGANKLNGQARMAAISKYWQTRHILNMVTSGTRWTMTFLFWRAHQLRWNVTQIFWNANQLFWNVYQLHWRLRPKLIVFFGKPFFFLAYQYRHRIRPFFRSPKSNP